MALIKCPECGKEISDKAERCNACGMPLNSIRKTKQNSAINIKKFVALIVIFLGVIGILNLIMNTKKISAPYYPTLYEVISETSVDEMLKTLGTGYEEERSDDGSVMFHCYDDYNLDGVQCRYINVSSLITDDSFYEFDISADVKKDVVDKFVSDITQIYGDAEIDKESNNVTYSWSKVNNMAPYLYVYENTDGTVEITLNIY